jgi:hypothetical protein
MSSSGVPLLIQSLSPSDEQLYHFVEQRGLLQPQQLALALKLQRQLCGPLEMIFWQLGFINSSELAQLWEFKASLALDHKS